MKVQPSRRNMLINKDEIINYQFQILEQSTPLAKPTISNTHKYSLWDLDSKIREAVGDHKYSVRWIGNSETAYLETYSYIMLIAASHSEANIIEFKQIIYKLGRQCLNLPEQKLLVEFLCLIQYSRDRYVFLNKYPQIQALLIKILQYVEDDSPPSQDSALEIKKKAKVRRKTSGKGLSKSVQKKQSLKSATHRSKNSESQQTQYEKELQEIYLGFNKHFEFISMLGSNEYSCSLRLFQTKKIFVIIEKDCYFMVQIGEKNQKTFLQFTLGNKYLMQHENEDVQQQIRPLTKEFDERNYFKCQEFEAIMDYQNQVQQSKVIPIERASQIRSPLSNRFGCSDPKKIEFFNIAAQHRLSFFNTVGEKNQVDIDKTFIDQLITNPAINSQKDLEKLPCVYTESRLPSHILTKKQQIMQKMKEFKKMKEAIQQVRERIEKKLKKIDEVQQFKSEVAQKNAEKYQSQKEDTQKSLAQKKEQQASQIFSQNNQKCKLDSGAHRKGSLNFPTSLQNLPEPKNLQDMITYHKSQRKLPQNLNLKNGKYLSQKAYSRPQSKVRSPEDQGQRSYNPNIKSIIANRKSSLDVALIQPLPPNNVNVNVNVSINENFLNPRYSSPTPSYLKQHLQKYASNKPNNHTQQWVSPNSPNFKWHQNTPNFYHYPSVNQEMSSNVLNAPWNIIKPNSPFNRK